MPNEPIEHEPSRERLEAYRPGTNDPADPQFAGLVEQLAAASELAARFREIERADGLIRAAMQDVAVPAGLAQRLLDRLEDARRESRLASSAAHVALPVPAERGMSGGVGQATFRPAAAVRRRFPYRAGWLASLAAGVAAALLLAVWLWPKRVEPLTPAAVREAAAAMFTAESPAAGFLLSEKAPPPDYPLGHDVLKMPDARWRWVAGFLGGDAVAYELVGPGGGRATLYVAHRTVDLLPSLPPDVPHSMTAGCSAAAWQQEGLLYVLVVEGDAGVYRSFLDRSRGPLT
jgi:hypothetical protein